MEYNIDLTTCPRNDEVEVYYPNGRLLCKTSDELLFDHIRGEIKEHMYEGFYVIHKGKKIEISKYGDPYEYPDGFFDAFGKALMRLL